MNTAELLKTLLHKISSDDSKFSDLEVLYDDRSISCCRVHFKNKFCMMVYLENNEFKFDFFDGTSLCLNISSPELLKELRVTLKCCIKKFRAFWTKKAKPKGPHNHFSKDL